MSLQIFISNNLCCYIVKNIHRHSSFPTMFANNSATNLIALSDNRY